MDVGVFEGLVLAVSCTVAGVGARSVWGPSRRPVPVRLGALTYECTRCHHRFKGISPVLSTGMDLTVLFNPEPMCSCTGERW